MADWALDGVQGGGEIMVKLPIVRELPPIHLTDEGMVKRIRGIAHSMKVSQQLVSSQKQAVGSGHLESRSF